MFTYFDTTFPSLISLMVSVDVREREKDTTFESPGAVSVKVEIVVLEFRSLTVLKATMNLNLQLSEM